MSAIDLTTLANVKQWLGLAGSPIISITLANPAVVTLSGTPAYPLFSLQTLALQGTGAIGVDGTWTITVITQTPTGVSFSIPVDTTLAAAYTTGGYAGVSDSLLQRLITAASQAILSIITRNIFAQTYTEVRNGIGGATMMLKNFPVSSVSSVNVNGVPILPRPPLGTSYTTTGVVGFVNDDKRVMLTGGLQFCPGFQNVTVVYAAGFATVPADLEQACIDTIAQWFKNKDRIGKASEGIEGQTIAFTKFDIPPLAMRIIQTYNSVAPVY